MNELYKTLEILSAADNWEDEPEALKDLMDYIISELDKKGIDFSKLNIAESHQLIEMRAGELMFDHIAQSLLKKGYIEPLIDDNGEVSYRVARKVDDKQGT